MTDDIPALLKTLEELRTAADAHGDWMAHQFGYDGEPSWAVCFGPHWMKYGDSSLMDEAKTKYLAAAANAIPALAAALRERDAEVERLVAVNAKICDFNREHSTAHALAVCDLVAAQQQLRYLWERTGLCSCGARRESPTRHPHVLGCPTAKAIEPTDADLARDAGFNESAPAIEDELRELAKDIPADAWLTEELVAARQRIAELEARNEILTRDALNWAERLEEAEAESAKWQAVMERTNADLAGLVAFATEAQQCQTRLEHPVQGVGADDEDLQQRIDIAQELIDGLSESTADEVIEGDAV